MWPLLLLLQLGILSHFAPEFWPWMIWPGCYLPFCQSLPGPHISICRMFLWQSKLSETCPRIRQISWPIDVPIIIDAFLLLDIQIRVRSSGYVNVFQWNEEWFFSRRVKLDSWLNMMAVYEVSWHGPKIISRFTSIQIWVFRWWKWRPFWFSKKINVTLSLNWSRPYQGGCSQVLISSKVFHSSICDWKNKFSFFGKYHIFRIESFRVDFRCVHRLQLLKVCDQYVTLPNSPRVQSVSKEQSR